MESHLVSHPLGVSSRIGFPTIQCSQKETPCGVYQFLRTQTTFLIFMGAWLQICHVSICQRILCIWLDLCHRTVRKHHAIGLSHPLFWDMTTSLRGAVAVTPVTPTVTIKVEIMGTWKACTCWAWAVCFVCQTEVLAMRGLTIVGCALWQWNETLLDWTSPHFLNNNSLFWLCFLEILASHVYGFWWCTIENGPFSTALCVITWVFCCSHQQERQESYWYFIRYFTGWWFGTFFIFPYIGNNHPNWLIFFNIFQRGWNHQPVCQNLSFFFLNEVAQVGSGWCSWDIRETKVWSSGSTQQAPNNRSLL